MKAYALDRKVIVITLLAIEACLVLATMIDAKGW